ncbi:MAG: hypothetical protein HYR76_13110 [Ignavibacteria bacterium]|nr:hypothetical protein [Ignavibacteria bacterium]
MNTTNNEDGSLQQLTSARENTSRSLRTWTKEEITFLKKHYVKRGRKFVAEHIQRTRTGVAGKARLLGLCIEVHRYWSPYEDRYIKRNFEKKQHDRLLAPYDARFIPSTHGQVCSS